MIIDVALGDRSYPIHVARGLIGNAAPLLGPLAPRGRLALVTDTAVAALHLPAFTAGLAAAGLAVDEIVLAPGEASKDWACLEHVTERLLQLGVERGDAIVALGGGVIGDLAGFAAAILRRGCKFVQVPTTLLAQVDSSVGGKTAINASAGKNLVGAFHQPELVLIDPDVLATLPLRQLSAGYAEVVKYGLIGDAGFFAWCEANAGALLAGDSGAQAYAIAASCRAKAAVVAADERETGYPRAAQPRPHIWSCLRGRSRLFGQTAPWRSGGARHGAGLRPVGGARPMPRRRRSAGAGAPRRRRL